jgi:hypothetical protein
MNDDRRCSGKRGKFTMTFKSATASVFVLLTALILASGVNRAFADSDHNGSEHASESHESGDDNGASSSNDDSSGGEVDDNDDAGSVSMGNKTSGKDCFVKRADGVKVHC